MNSKNEIVNHGRNLFIKQEGREPSIVEEIAMLRNLIFHGESQIVLRERPEDDVAIRESVKIWREQVRKLEQSRFPA